MGGYNRTSVFNVDTNQWEVIDNKNKNVRKYGAPSLITATQSPYDTLNQDPVWQYGEAGVRINKIKIEAYGPGPSYSNSGYSPRGIFLIF